MAIYHLHVGIVSRKTGRSSVAAAAYRAAQKLYNYRDGMTHDYTKKFGVMHTEIMLPHNAPSELLDRSTFWNAVEKAEKRCDAQTARDISESGFHKKNRDWNKPEYLGRVGTKLEYGFANANFSACKAEEAGLLAQANRVVLKIIIKRNFQS